MLLIEAPRGEWMAVCDFVLRRTLAVRIARIDGVWRIDQTRWLCCESFTDSLPTLDWQSDSKTLCVRPSANSYRAIERALLTQFQC
jgi:hypothetical protein